MCELQAHVEKDLLMRNAIALAVALAALSGPVHAGHNNPWATPDDVILSKKHDANQVKSADTPGEDEMRGAVTQAGSGKVGGPEGGEEASSGSRGGGQGSHGGGRDGRSGGGKRGQ